MLSKGPSLYAHIYHIDTQTHTDIGMLSTGIPLDLHRHSHIHIHNSIHICPSPSSTNCVATRV